MSDKPGTEAVLETRPELRAAIADILPVDEERDGWTFDDIPVDSGLFGELVSAGIVEKDGDQYRVADPETVRAVLDGDATVDTDDSGFDRSLRKAFDVDAGVDRRAAGLLAGALFVVLLSRTYVIGSIYRGGDIVLSGNDPYSYRYHIEQIATEASGAADLGALSVLPGGLTKGEPLMVATLWWVASLLGGSTAAIGHVLAWYPVLSALLSAVLLYLLAVRVTGDRRVGLASVLFLAFIPGHAFRTSLGFADHHAFDYPWLGITALALVVILTSVRDRESLRRPLPWLAATGLGIGIAGQVLAWNAGPLLIVPVGIAVTAKTLLDVASGRSSLVTNAPVLAGTALGAVLTGLVHLTAGWQATVVASTPALLAGGVLGVTLTAEGVRRLGWRQRELAVVDAAGGLTAILVLRFGFPAQWDTLRDQTGLLFRGDAIAETSGLFNFETFGFLFLFGLTLVLALPAMVWGIQQAREGETGWLVVSSYAWFLFLLATIQVRFVGELATFAALFTGYAFVWVASWTDVARPVTPKPTGELTATKIPEKRTLVSLVALFLLFGAAGMVQVPVKTSQVVIDDGTYNAASAIEADAVDRQLEYPENFVLSTWGRNRVYNYFVNGQSSGYGYAQQNYPPFLAATDPDESYQLVEGDVGYVVTTETPLEEPQTTYVRLHEAYGSRSGSVPGTGHFRPVFVSADGGHKAFAVVPGATLRGTASANATVTVRTTVAVSGTSFDYERQTSTDSAGRFAVTVANPGSYTVTEDSGSGETTARVSEDAVYEGQNVTVEDRP